MADFAPKNLKFFEYSPRGTRLLIVPRMFDEGAIN
jgi:hypothetical protein